jgi:hypothetical protein
MARPLGSSSADPMHPTWPGQPPCWLGASYVSAWSACAFQARDPGPRWVAQDQEPLVERVRYRSRSRAIFAMWWMNSRLLAQMTVMNGNSAAFAPGVPAVADGVELLVGHGRDAVAPAVHRRPEPLQRHRGRGAEADELPGRLASSAEGPLPAPGEVQVQVPQPPGDRGDRGRVGIAGGVVEQPLARPERWWWWSPDGTTAPVPPVTGQPRGPKLLGVRAILAESLERIHRSNLIGMGICPCSPSQASRPSRSARPVRRPSPSAGVRRGLPDPTPRRGPRGRDRLPARVRLDTRREADYYRHGGVLPYVLRSLLGP